MEKIISSGKRKRAVARAILMSGTGKVSVNRIDYEKLQFFDKLKMQEPLRIAEYILGKPNFNAEITVKGGGARGQIEAARIALAKGIVAFSREDKLKRAYQEYDRNLLVADVRRKEAYKPGDSKARAKRQKSFR